MKIRLVHHFRKWNYSLPKKKNWQISITFSGSVVGGKQFENIASKFYVRRSRTRPAVIPKHKSRMPCQTGKSRRWPTEITILVSYFSRLLSKSVRWSFWFLRSLSWSTLRPWWRLTQAALRIKRVGTVENDKSKPLTVYVWVHLKCVSVS